MDTITLKARILVPLALASTLVLSVFVFGVYHEEQEHLTADLGRSIQAVERHYRATLDERAHKLGAALEVIAADPVLRSAMAAHDRDTLLERAMPVFQRLKSQHNVTHFYFHDEKRINILRVHQPNRFGDKIDRFTAVGAEKSNALTHGVELGPLGTFTLRAVLPVREGNKLLGYIELGEEVDQIIQDMERVFGIELVTFIDKRYLLRTDWISGMAMLGRDAQWEQFPSVVVVSQTVEQLPQGLSAILSDPIEKFPSRDIDVTRKEQRFQGRILPLRDAGGRTVGGMVVLRDMTERIQSTSRAIILLVGGASVLGAILFLMFYIILDRTQGRLTALMGGLQEKEHDLRLFRNLIDHSNDAIEVIDPVTLRFLDVNQKQCFVLGYTRDELLSMTVNDIDPTFGRADMDMIDAQIAETGAAVFERRHRRKDGSTFPVEIGLRFVEIEGRTYVLSIARDITERKAKDHDLHLFRSLIDNSNDAIEVVDPDTMRLLDVNERACRDVGYTRDELLSMTVLDIDASLNSDSIAVVVDQLQKDGAAVFESTHRRKDGTVFPVEVSVRFLEVDNKPYLTSIVRDITERKHYVEELEHKALYDVLTELPNRSLLQDRLGHALKAAHRNTSPLAVIILDVIRLGEINDLLGHQAGDLVLKEVANRLQNGLRETDTVARLGSDEFAMVLPSVSIDRVHLTVERLQKQFEQPVIIDGTSLELEVAIGIAQYPDHGDTTTILLQHADIAMRLAKHETSGFSIYSSQYDPFSARQLKLHGELRQAICDKQLVVFYQPKIDIKTGRIVSMEALARWPHPTEGMISPADFIPMVEQSGLIRPFTHWVLEQAIMQLKHWAETGIDLTVAVNLSTRNLLDPGLADSITNLLESNQVGPERLILEITESALMSRPEQALKILTNLHNLGLKLSIDDFGTGYSSLAYLKRFPVAELKIDHSFILGMVADESDAVIVRSTIELAHNLGLSVVAEGVEDKEILDLLATLRCDVGQGYYFSRPLPAQELEAWLRDSPWGQGSGKGFDTALVRDG